MLEAYSWRSVSERLVFALEDPQAPWNSGVWELVVEGGRASVRLADAAPELTASQTAFVQMYMGSATPHQLREHGADFQASDRAVAACERLFGGGVPWMLEAF